jgi:hypothetical protein
VQQAVANARVSSSVQALWRRNRRRARRKHQDCSLQACGRCFTATVADEVRQQRGAHGASAEHRPRGSRGGGSRLARHDVARHNGGNSSRGGRAWTNGGRAWLRALCALLLEAVEHTANLYFVVSGFGTA